MNSKVNLSLTVVLMAGFSVNAHAGQFSQMLACRAALAGDNLGYVQSDGQVNKDSESSVDYFPSHPVSIDPGLALLKKPLMVIPDQRAPGEYFLVTDDSIYKVSGINASSGGQTAFTGSLNGLQLLLTAAPTGLDVSAVPSNPSAYIKSRLAQAKNTPFSDLLTDTTRKAVVKGLETLITHAYKMTIKTANICRRVNSNINNVVNNKCENDNLPCYETASKTSNGATSLKQKVGSGE